MSKARIQKFASVSATDGKISRESVMKRFSTGFLIAVFMFAPVMAEEVPFATAPL